MNEVNDKNIDNVVFKVLERFIGTIEDTEALRFLPLTGPVIQLNDVQMLEFLMCIEESFCISFSYEEIARYRLRCIQDYISSIERRKISLPRSKALPAESYTSN